MHHQVALLVSILRGFGALLTKLGLLVIGCGMFRQARFPGWLAVGFAAQAVVGLTFETTSILGISSPLVFPLTVVYVFACLVWDIATAKLFWRGARGGNLRRLVLMRRPEGFPGHIGTGAPSTRDSHRGTVGPTDVRCALTGQLE
jgi:hypothetical protein